MNEVQSASNIGGKDYVQPKEWDQLSTEEKIERTRQMVRGLIDSMNYANRQIHNVRSKLVKHEHIDGKVVEKKVINVYDSEIGSDTLNKVDSSNKFF